MRTEPIDTEQSTSGSGPLKESQGGSSASSQDKSNKYLLDRFADLSKEHEAQKEQLNEYWNYFAEYVKKLETTKDDQETFKVKVEKEFNKLDSDKIRIIEVVGVFLALLTFVSVEFQILPKADNFFELAGLSILLFSGLSLFVAVLVQVCESWLNPNRDYNLYKNKFIVVATGLTILGVGIGSLGFYLERSERIGQNESLEETPVQVTDVVSNEQTASTATTSKTTESE